MRMLKPGWLSRFRRRNDPFHRAKHGDLDIIMPPPYEMSDAAQQEARQKVESLIGQLQPNGLDGNSRDVLNNLINAWMDQEIARLHSHREEWKAVAGMLTGLAREEVARHRHRYEADYARAQQARQTLALAYEQLTGAQLTDLPSPYSRHVPGDPVRSILGPVMRLTDAPGPQVAPPSANGHGKPGSDGAVTPEGAGT
jgi:hypothetical protein